MPARPSGFRLVVGNRGYWRRSPDLLGGARPSRANGVHMRPHPPCLPEAGTRPVNRTTRRVALAMAGGTFPGPGRRARTAGPSCATRQTTSAQNGCTDTLSADPPAGGPGWTGARVLAPCQATWLCGGRGIADRPSVRAIATRARVRRKLMPGLRFRNRSAPLLAADAPDRRSRLREAGRPGGSPPPAACAWPRSAFRSRRSSSRTRSDVPDVRQPDPPRGRPATT